MTLHAGNVRGEEVHAMVVEVSAGSVVVLRGAPDLEAITA
jgi:hypothetical protein